MHWILWIGINWAANTSMGSFESEAACNKAAASLIELLGDPKKNTVAACMLEERR